MCTARDKDRVLAEQIARRTGKQVDVDVANTLRRASMTLQRWAELECGDGNSYASWAIERDDNGDGPPYMVRHHYRHGAGKDTVSRTRIPDRERGALKRVAAVCERAGLSFYHQTDPRGCALYVDAERLTDQNYNNGVAI